MYASPPVIANKTLPAIAKPHGEGRGMNIRRLSPQTAELLGARRERPADGVPRVLIVDACFGIWWLILDRALLAESTQQGIA
jgi:hypothetical protein